MDLKNLQEQFKGRKFGELVLHHLRNQSGSDRVKPLQWTIKKLP